MNLIPGLPVAAALLLLLLAASAPLLLDESRQRSLLAATAFWAGLWALTGALFWQGVPLLAPVFAALSLWLLWCQWRLFVVVGHTELRRRTLLWLGRLTLLVLLLAALVHRGEPWLVEGQWRNLALLRLGALVAVVLALLALLEWLLALVLPRERSRAAPWLGVWALLTGGVAWDLAAALPGLAGRLPPVGSGLLALALLLGLGLSLRRSGPFPLQGGVPPAAFGHVRDAVLLVDGAQRIQAATPAAADLLEHSSRSLLGRRLQSVLPGAAAAGDAWEPPTWLAREDRLDGGLWLHWGDLHAQQGGQIARLLHLRGGNAMPPESVPVRAHAAARRTWSQGPVVQQTLEATLRRYGAGRQALAASVHVDYDWVRVQQEHGDAVLDGLVERVAQRLLEVCDWTVECLRLGRGQFVLLLTDVTGPEEVNLLAERAQSLLAQPYLMARKRWEFALQIAVVPDLRLYRRVSDWLQDADAALRQSRGQSVTTTPPAERRARLSLALEQSLLHDGIDWDAEPVLNLTTQQFAAWRLHPRWSPEADVLWEDERLIDAVAGLHMQRAFYTQAASQAGAWPGPAWLPLRLEDLASALQGLGRAGAELLLELDRLDTEVLHAQNLRAVRGEAQYIAPMQGGRAFGYGLQPVVIRLEPELVLPGLADDLPRQALIRGARAAARGRDQRLYAAGVASALELKTLRELGVDYASGPAVGARVSPRQAPGLRRRPRL